MSVKVRAEVEMKVLAIIVAGIALASCNPFEAKIISVCEEVLKERLRSPSGYKRIRISQTETPLTGGEYLALQSSPPGPNLTRLILEQYEAGQVKPTRLTLLIEYDAPNAFNAPIRGFAKCEHVSIDNGRSASTFDTQVDGKTKWQWLTESIRRP